MKKNNLKHSFLLAIALLGSCMTQAQETESSKDFVKKLKTGVLSYEENKYIYFEELNSNHGILIIDHELDDIDGTYYELFYKKEKYIFQTSNLSLLKKRLSVLPKGTTLDWYDTCTFSKMEGLTENKKQAFINLCDSLKINLITPSWEESRNIVCYCMKLRKQ